MEQRARIACDEFRSEKKQCEKKKSLSIRLLHEIEEFQHVGAQQTIYSSSRANCMEPIDIRLKDDHDPEHQPLLKANLKGNLELKISAIEQAMQEYGTSQY